MRKPNPIKFKPGDPWILVYDIEKPLKGAYVWGCGKQVIRHNQLIPGRDREEIICISYAWLHGGPVKTLSWDYKTRNSKRMMKEFTKVLEKADVVIGKNNLYFDDKHVATQRLLHELEPMPDLIDRSDDLQVKLKRFFSAPSQSLDYWSKLLGLGGKIRMMFEDWVDLDQGGEAGERAMKKFLRYCPKDVSDTRAIILHILPYVKWRFNYSVYKGQRCCIQPLCGSTDIHKNGTKPKGSTIMQRWHCNAHGGFAGYSALKARPDAPLRG